MQLVSLEDKVRLEDLVVPAHLDHLEHRVLLDQQVCSIQTFFSDWIIFIELYWIKTINIWTDIFNVGVFC